MPPFDVVDFGSLSCDGLQQTVLMNNYWTNYNEQRSFVSGGNPERTCMPGRQVQAPAGEVQAGTGRRRPALSLLPEWWSSAGSAR